MNNRIPTEGGYLFERKEQKLEEIAERMEPANGKLVW